METDIKLWSDDELLEMLAPDIEKSTQVQDTLSGQRAEYYKRYRGEPYGNEREGFAQSVAPVIHNNHKWTLANLMDIFNEDFFVLKGDDDVRASNFQKLIYYQMFRKQDGFRKFYDFLWTADLFHYAVFKCYYKEDFDLENNVYDSLTADEMSQLAMTENVTISKYDEETDEMGGVTYKNVKTVTKKILYAGPSFSVPPLWEIFYSPDCRITEWGAIEGRLVRHDTRKTLNDIRKKEKAGIYRKGTYEKVKDKFTDSFGDAEDKVEVLFNVDDVTAIETNVESDRKDTILGREVVVQECYCKLDIDGDGLLEPVIIDICDDVVCRVVENPYKRPPFRFGSVAPEPHKIAGVAPAELLDYDQKVQTNLLRLIQDSAALDCYKNPVTSDHQMFAYLENRKPFAVIKGDPDKLGEVKSSPPSNFVLKAYELLKQANEEKTGITRYNQGQDASSLNKTATGIDAIMAASNKPLRLIARLVGNGAVLGLIRDFIYINQLYPAATDQKILGTDIEVKPEDMNGAYDIEIDIGVSPAERQAMANQVDLMIQFATQAGLQMGLMDRVHVLRAMKKKYRYLGSKIDDLMKTEQQLIQEEQQKAQEPPKQQDWKEFVQMDKIFLVLTPMEQYQILTQLGIKPDPRRQQMPPEALSGERTSQGGQPDPMKQMEAQMNMKMKAQEHGQKIQQADQSHKMAMAKQLMDMKTAMDTQQSGKRPYPQGV